MAHRGALGTEYSLKGSENEVWNWNKQGKKGLKTQAVKDKPKQGS